MNVSGKINLFVNVVGGNRYFSTTLSSLEQGENAVYENYYLDVRFDKKHFVKEQLALFQENKCYTIEILKGWLTFRSYEKDGKKIKKPVIHIVEAKTEKVINCKRKDTDDLPF